MMLLIRLQILFMFLITARHLLPSRTFALPADKFERKKNLVYICFPILKAIASTLAALFLKGTLGSICSRIILCIVTISSQIYNSGASTALIIAS